MAKRENPFLPETLCRICVSSGSMAIESHLRSNVTMKRLNLSHCAGPNLVRVSTNAFSSSALSLPSMKLIEHCGHCTSGIPHVSQSDSSMERVHSLLLNRRNTGVESTLFTNEPEKFCPYQQRLASAVHHQHTTLQEVTDLWRKLRDHAWAANRGPGAKKWEEREKRKKDTIERFSRARNGYMEVRDGIA